MKDRERFRNVGRLSISFKQTVDEEHFPAERNSFGNTSWNMCIR